MIVVYAPLGRHPLLYVTEPARRPTHTPPPREHSPRGRLDPYPPTFSRVQHHTLPGKNPEPRRAGWIRLSSYPTIIETNSADYSMYPAALGCAVHADYTMYRRRVTPLKLAARRFASPVDACRASRRWVGLRCCALQRPARWKPRH